MDSFFRMLLDFFPRLRQLLIKSVFRIILAWLFTTEAIFVSLYFLYAAFPAWQSCTKTTERDLCCFSLCLFRICIYCIVFSSLLPPVNRFRASISFVLQKAFLVNCTLIMPCFIHFLLTTSKAISRLSVCIEKRNGIFLLGSKRRGEFIIFKISFSIDQFYVWKPGKFSSNCPSSIARKQFITFLFAEICKNFSSNIAISLHVLFWPFVCSPNKIWLWIFFYYDRRSTSTITSYLHRSCNTGAVLFPIGAAHSA